MTQLKNEDLYRIIEKLQQEKEQLQKNEEKYRLLVENSGDAVWRLDSQLRFEYVSPATEDIVGYKANELIGKSLLFLLSPESANDVKRAFLARKPLMDSGQRWGYSTFTVTVNSQDGSQVWIEVVVNPIFGAANNLVGYNGITRDISERKRQEELIRQYAFMDPLTNLPNRRLFKDELARAINRSDRLQERLAVLFLDIDGLKKVNDQHGHVAGDVLLQVVADRLRREMRKLDFVARLGGDEFMLILPGLGDSVAVSPFATG